MLVKNKKGVWLLVISAAKQIDWKLVKKVVGKVELVPLEEVPSLTGCISGAVPPFGSQLGEGGISTFMDQSLQDQGDVICFNAVSIHLRIHDVGFAYTFNQNELCRLYSYRKANHCSIFKMMCLLKQKPNYGFSPT